MAIHIGDLGTADTEPRPHGFVTVCGERRDARCPHGTISAGAVVAVVAGDHFGLVVQLVHDRPPVLPNHGQPVLASFGECVSSEAERAAADRSRWLARHRRRGLRLAAAVGAASAVGTAVRLWDELPDWAGEPILPAIALVLAGGALGAVAFRLLDDAVGDADPGFRRVTPVSVGLGLIGTFATAAGCVPNMSLPAALTAAAVTGLLLAAAPLGLLAAAGGEG